MGKLREVKSEKEFLSILKKFAKQYYKKFNTVNFLGLVENEWSSETDYLWKAYFAIGNMYDYVNGNETLKSLVKEWVKTK